MWGEGEKVWGEAEDLGDEDWERGRRMGRIGEEAGQSIDFSCCQIALANLRMNKLSVYCAGLIVSRTFLSSRCLSIHNSKLSV